VILNDNQIRARCEWTDQPPMISPYMYAQCRAVTFLDNPLRLSSQTIPVISFGQSSFGYDIRLAADGLSRFINPKTDLPWQDSAENDFVIDPKAFNECEMLLSQSVQRDETGLFYTLPPRAYALGVSVETFNIPHNILGICYCKSTYARCGLMVNTTPLEPGWRGQLVIEMANLTDLPMKVYANEGIAQVVFFEGDVPATTYADRSGKYQDQKGIVTARI
jgi:dCTP deaminase